MLGTRQTPATELAISSLIAVSMQVSTFVWKGSDVPQEEFVRVTFVRPDG